MSALPPAYCGRCGLALPPGAGFCGRCGAAQTVQAAPVYAYAPTAAVAQAAGHGRLSHRGLLAVGGGILAVLVVVGAFAFHLTGQPVPKCRFNDCSTLRGSALADVHTYTSRQYGFQVDYSDRFQVSDQDNGHINFNVENSDGSGVIGFIAVTGQAAAKSPDQMIDDAINTLSSNQLQGSAQATGPVNGAHIGSQIGAGRVYDANLYANGAQGQHVRVVVIAAVDSQTNVGVVVTCIETFRDSKSDHSGLADPRTLDYMLAEFRWSANS